jgi:hypothetical protein
MGLICLFPISGKRSLGFSSKSFLVFTLKFASDS